jgi:phosphate transport system protein
MAHDLRLLLASFSIAAELERMGDYAEGIARTVLRYPEEGLGDIPSQMGDMTIHVRRMLAQSLEAYAREDVAAAEAAAQTDDLVDRLYRQMFKWIVEQMSEGKILAERGTYLLWAGHNLERMGDRITNICERVLFSKTGAIEREMNPKGEHKEPPR